MKTSFALMLCLNLILCSALGQKKIIDVSACNEWERIEEIDSKPCLLSSHGSFIMFKTFSASTGATTVLKNLKSNTERSFLGTYSEGSFDGDNMFAFQLQRDSLVIFDTKRDTYIYITGVRRYFIIKSEGADKVAYFTEDAGKKLLIVWDAKEGKIKELPGVYDDRYWLNKSRTALLTRGSDGLTYTDLRSLKSMLITSDPNVENAAFNSRGDEIVYILNGSKGKELSFFDINLKEGYALISDSSDYLKNNWKLEPNGVLFDNDDGNVFFKVSSSGNYFERQHDDVITSDVNVWSYQDLYLQDRQLSALNSPRPLTFMINVRKKKVVQLESAELSLELLGNTNKYCVLTSRINENEFYWNKEKMGIYLFSVDAGNRILIKESMHPGFRVVGVSPDNRFLIWFDGSDGDYYSYNIETRKISNISRFNDGTFRLIKQRHEDVPIIHNASPYEGQYWIDNGSSLIVYSRNDIWQLDPLAVRAPVNLTNGYGQSNDIRFRLVEKDGTLFKLNDKDFLIWAFDNRSKQNGFWKSNMDKSVDPVKLIMSDDAFFFDPLSPVVSANSAQDPTRFKPIKASKENLFIVRKMNSSQAPNLYYTKDFRSFIQLTQVNPNKDYVWISTKLITYVLPNGQKAEGILHRPDNFDSTRQYPIIFNYYERRSECLNVFRTPELSGHNINIPWYVSRGYLVFEPDFYYKRGETAKSVIKSVESALVELRKLPYVNQNKMGIQGQSHGGYETNVLATGTQLFAAACEMAGFTDVISEYGSIRPGGHNNQSAADVGQRNLGVFPWDHPEVFIENSPVFHVSKMTTPLLMVHNKEDGAVLFSQAIELYLSMRRLGKEVWLLQYDKEGHEINEINNKLDFTIRMQQFFDHYLKDAPAPVWMSKGIPASLKGIVSGLQYETSLMGRNK